jgi:hypothetical protein
MAQGEKVKVFRGMYIMDGRADNERNAREYAFSPTQYVWKENKSGRRNKYTNYY